MLKMHHHLLLCMVLFVIVGGVFVVCVFAVWLFLFYLVFVVF